MTILPRLLALSLAGLGAHACAPACDEPGLRSAAGMLAAGTRQAGLDALGAACPTLPPALAQGLAAGESSSAAAEDPAWRALLARLCPAATHASGAATVHEELDGMRQLCDLDRHDLLAAGEAYARDDLFVYALFEWLLAGRVDRTLATSVARPLLSAHEFAAEGLTLPDGRTDVPLRRPDLEVHITPTAVAVGGVWVLPLERGRPAPGTFIDHVSDDLLPAFAGPAKLAKQRAEDRGRPWHARLTLLVDRSVPYGTLTDVLHTALAADYSDFALVVHDGRELHGLPFSLPRMWFPDEIEEVGFRNPELSLAFVVDARSVVVHDGRGSREGQRFPLPAGASIAQLVAKLKGLFPNEVVARYHVADDVPLQAVVSLIDTVSGDGCRLAGALRGEAVPDECLFWQTVLDSEPPFIHAKHRR